MDVAGFLRRWARAVFTIDLRSLALFRIALALALGVDLATRAPFLTTSYTDAGAHPRWAMTDFHDPRTLPSLHMAFGSFEAQAVLFGVAALAAVALALGWRTRTATVVCWLLLDSLHFRNRMVNLGGDALLRFLLFWCMFLPLGARASLDALRQRAGRTGPAPTSVCSVGSAALLLQVGCMFWMTGMLKTGPKWTEEGTAIYYALSRAWQVRPFGEWLLDHPELTEWLTPAVLWFERVVPLLLFVPIGTAVVRLLAVPAFWGLMFGLGIGLRLGVFPWVGSIAVLPFLPALAWRLASRDPSPDVPYERPATGVRRVVQRGLQALVVVAIALVLWINAGTRDERLRPPEPLVRLANLVHLKQSWPMYAPQPKPVDIYVRHRGRLRSGAEIDLDAGQQGEGWTEVEKAWRDFRFEWSLQRIAGPGREKPLGAYAQWLCRQWNRDHEGPARLDWVGVERVWRDVPPPGEPETPPRIRQLIGLRCPR